MSDIHKLLQRNQSWARARRAADADFFPSLQRQHKPTYLWIGCSDSRVPANEILGMPAGTVFVHRNVANIIRADDPNCTAVVQYALEGLGIRDLIVCGHYGCGGVECARTSSGPDSVCNWTAEIRTDAKLYLGELADEAMTPAMCELNVVRQCYNLSTLTCVQRAWKHDPGITIHGLIYSLTDGIVRPILTPIDGHGTVPELEDLVDGWRTRREVAD